MSVSNESIKDTAKDAITKKTLEELRAMKIPETNDDDFDKPMLKIDRPMVWIRPAAQAAIEFNKESVRKIRPAGISIRHKVPD